MGRARARRPGRIDGLKVRIVDAPALTDVELGVTLRSLARMLVRSYEAHGDHEVIDLESRSSSKLTVGPHPRPDHGTDEAA
jgi:hypothetical protein